MEPLELVPLCKALMPVHETHAIEGTPEGSLLIGELRGATLEGERLNARQVGHAAADWLTVSPAGFATVDVRITFKTDDGALLFMSYEGRSNLETGVACAAPKFKTGDPRYAWLNGIQAIAKGLWEPEKMCVTYPMVYEVR
jgi:hypothetical protein